MRGQSDSRLDRTSAARELLQSESCERVFWETRPLFRQTVVEVGGATDCSHRRVPPRETGLSCDREASLPFALDEGQTDYSNASQSESPQPAPQPCDNRLYSHGPLLFQRPVATSDRD